VEKMRTAKHSMEKFAFEFENGEINILGPIFE
jgi:KaiC/GvpD/RAD55 family RecA-like ATPase